MMGAQILIFQKEDCVKQLKCTDVCPEGVSDCTYVIEGETDEDVLSKMKTHVTIVHSDVMDGMTPEMIETWVERARKKIITT